MAQKTNKIERFWKELKRRKVVHVITVYAAVSFVILQLVDIVERPLRLPDWTTALVIVLLCIGFIICVFVSWVYDITPAGVKKTKPARAVRQIDQTAKPASSGWKIATYVSGIIIVALVAFNFISKRNLNTNLSKTEKSIAVLPFINDSPDTTNTYFINGLMDKITTDLQMVKELRVVSRTSVEQYRNRTKSISEIAKELDVNFIVEGNGQKYGSSFSVDVKLIKAKGKETHLWSKPYEQEIKEVKDYIRIQSQIAQAIATELKAVITPEEKQLIEKTPTTSLTALDFFQRGRDEHVKYWLDNTKTKALENAISYYKLALNNDSTFSQAYTGLAMARYNYYWRGVYINMDFSENDMKLVRDSVVSLADKALFYNKNLDEAYLVRGLCSENDDMAIHEYRKSLGINPNYGLAYHAIANLLFYDKNESIDGIKNKLKSIELERGPMLPVFLNELGLWYETLGFYENALDVYNQIFQLTNDTLQYFRNMSGPYFADENWEESIRWAKKILDKNPTDFWGHYQLAGIYLYLGETDLASYHVNQIKDLSFYTSENTAFLTVEVQMYEGFILWKRGDKVKASAVFDKVIGFSDKLIKSGTNIDYPSLILAGIFSLKGQQKKALEYFNKIGLKFFTQRYVIVIMENTPLLQNLRSDKRFQEILSTSKSNWQKEHDKVRIWLEENHLLKI